MTRKTPTDRSEPDTGSATARPLTDAARRALAEAEERRRAKAAGAQGTEAAEVGGRPGPDPVRYGDWEKDGLASDF